MLLKARGSQNTTGGSKPGETDKHKLADGVWFKNFWGFTALATEFPLY